MTVREDPPNNPSCPRCGLNDRVVTLEPPTMRGTQLADAPSPWPFECARCVLLMRGTDDEWVRMSGVRAKYRDDHKPRTMPGGDS